LSLRLGLDLGASLVKCAVLDGGRVVATATAPNDGERGEEAVLARVVALGLETAAPHGPIAAAGVGLPGHFEACPTCPASGWDGRSPGRWPTGSVCR
jgi:predicted NBD/HSP70 family sugar kinase